MDTSALHTLTDDLAAFLSEVTRDELGRPTPGPLGDVGDLYLHVLHQNVGCAAALVGAAIPRAGWHVPTDRSAIERSADLSGECGLDVGYRTTARLMLDAFASVSERATLHRPGGSTDATTLYETQVCDTLLYTWEISQVLGLTYRPSRDIARRALRTIALALPIAPALPATASTAQASGDDGAFECVLRLSGRQLSGSSPAR